MNGVKRRLLSDWAQVLAWNIIRCVVAEESTGEIIMWLLRCITRDYNRRNDMRHHRTGLLFSRVPSIAPLPESANPKSSTMVEASAVIIGITNNRGNYGLW